MFGNSDFSVNFDGDKVYLYHAVDHDENRAMEFLDQLEEEDIRCAVAEAATHSPGEHYKLLKTYDWNHAVQQLLGDESYG